MILSAMPCSLAEMTIQPNKPVLCHPGPGSNESKRVIESHRRLSGWRSIHKPREEEDRMSGFQLQPPGNVMEPEPGNRRRLKASLKSGGHPWPGWQAFTCSKARRQGPTIHASASPA